VRYEAAGQQTGNPGERRRPDVLVSAKSSWRVQQEVRCTPPTPNHGAAIGPA
jgi:hypothetical protein